MEYFVEPAAELPEPQAESSATGARSTRTRVKSQRALEAEHLEQLMARARAQAKGLDTSGMVGPPTAVVQTKKPRAKGRKKKEMEEYCICKTSGDDGRAMIECGVCNDWFHFDCINLDVDAAELIHKYVCDACETRTGEKTSHIYDIGIFPAPSPPPGYELAPTTKPSAKRKVKSKPQARSSAPPSASGSSSEETGSEAEDDGNSSSSDEGSDAAEKTTSIRKKPRLSKEPKPPRQNRLPSIDKKPLIRKPSATVPAPVPAGALPPARAHVLNRLTTVVEKLFAGKLDQKEAERYAIELESAVWLHFKDVVAGKGVAGSKYKTQFNLLASSLAREIRPELRESIISQTLTPSQVALLTSADLASAARAKEIEAARQAVLQQTVKTKAAQEPTAIRLGRDGLERAEDVREKEMVAIQAAERVARDQQQRRESLTSVAEKEGDVVDVARDEGSTPQVSSTMQPARSGSVDTPAAGVASTPTPGPVARVGATSTTPSESPRPTPTRASFSLSSAWGAKEKGPEVDTADVEMAFGGGDQSQLDLSDLVAGEPEEVDFTKLSEENVDDWSNFLRKPVVWSGTLSNPKFDSPGPGPFVMRQVAPAPYPPNWNELLPHSHAAMTGRLPAKASLDFLVTARVSPRKRLIVVAWTANPDAPKEEQEWFEAILEDYIAQGKHAVYHPYGESKTTPIPPGAAREMYLVPLGRDDPIPDFAELTDGFEIPARRPENIFLAAFVVLKDDDRRISHAPNPPQVLEPSYAAMPAPTALHPPVSAPVQSEKLQELMKNLNPAAIASLVGPSPPHGGLSPLATTGVPVIHAVPTPTGPMSWQGYSGPGQAQGHGYPPYGSEQGYQSGYPGPSQGYQPGPAHGGWAAPPQGYGYAPPPQQEHYSQQPGYGQGWDDRAYGPGTGRHDQPGYGGRGGGGGRGGRSGSGGGGGGGRGGGGGGRFEGMPRDSGWGNRGGGRSG